MLIFFSLPFFHLYAQITTAPGYVVMHRGDTVRGNILYHKKWQLASELHFRMSGREQTFKPSDIRAFGMDNESWVSAQVKVSEMMDEEAMTMYHMDAPKRDVFGLNAKGDSIIVQIKTQQVFLLNLVSGQANLYTFEEENGTEHYYVQVDDSEFEEMVQFHAGMFDFRNSYTLELYRIRDSQYKQALISLFYACPKLHARINRAKVLTKDLLQKFTAAYNVCTTGSEGEMHENARDIVYRTGPVLAYTLLNPSFSFTSSILGNGSGFSYLNTASETWYSGLSGGWGTELTFTGSQRRFSLSAELLFQAFKMNYEYAEGSSESISSGDYRLQEIDFAALRTKIPIMFRYHLTQGEIRPFIGAGYQPILYFANRNVRTQRTFFSGDEVGSQELEALPNKRKIENGFGVEAGVKVNPWRILIRYEWGNGFTRNGNVKSYNQTIGIVLGYLFGV